MKKLNLYICCALLSLIWAGCTPGSDKIIAPNGIYEDLSAQTILVNDAAGRRVMRISKEGKMIASSADMGAQINDLIVDGDKIVLVAGDFGGEILSLNKENLEVIERRVIGHTPSSILADSRRGVYLVTLRHEQALVGLEMDDWSERFRIAVGREPNDMLCYDSGAKLLVSNNLPEQPSNAFPVAAALKVVDLENQELQKSVTLANGSTDIKAMAMDSDANFAYITHLLARYQLPTNQVDRGWMNTNAMSVYDLRKDTLVATILLDTPQRGAANPWGIALSKDNKQIVVALSGSHEVLILDRDSLHSRLEKAALGMAVSHSSGKYEDIVNDASFAHGIKEFIPAKGNGTRAILPLGGDLFVANYFSGEISKFDIEGLNANSQGELLFKGRSIATTKTGEGEMYFHDAKLCFQQWQSCASCHPNDARMDGLNWDLLNDGMGNPKNTKSLLLAHSTPPSMVTGIRADANTAVRSGFKHIFFAKVDESISVAVDKYLMSLKPTKSPHLTQEGGLSEKALRGKTVFEKHCTDCHSGSHYTNGLQYIVQWANPREANTPMDVPSLVETWRTAPYFYDGRSYTMANVLEVHGLKATLSQAQMSDLESYVLSL